jgi:hypothetical protein
VTESAIEAACCAYAVKRGCIPLKQSGGEVGTPDRVFLLPRGKVLVVEFKAPDGRLSPRQKLVFEKYAERGHPVLIIRQVKTFKLVLDLLLGEGVD